MLLTTEQIREKLSGADLKVTPQRLLLFQALCASTQHPTAEEIYAEVAPKLPGLSLATVYANLETLHSKRLIEKVPVADGKMRYDARIESHHHFYCTHTREIIDFDDPGLEKLIREYMKGKSIENFTIEGISLNIRGTKNQQNNPIKFS